MNNIPDWLLAIVIVVAYLNGTVLGALFMRNRLRRELHLRDEALSEAQVAVTEARLHLARYRQAEEMLRSIVDASRPGVPPSNFWN